MTIFLNNIWLKREDSGVHRDATMIVQIQWQNDTNYIWLNDHYGIVSMGKYGVAVDVFDMTAPLFDPIYNRVRYLATRIVISKAKTYEGSHHCNRKILWSPSNEARLEALNKINPLPTPIKQHLEQWERVFKI